MRSIFFGFMVFAMWATFSRYYYVCKIKNHCGTSIVESVKKTATKAPLAPITSSKRANTLNLAYKNKNVLSGFQQFHFDNGSVTPDLTENNNKFISTLLGDPLLGNDKYNMKITGYYRPSEKNAKSGIYENIGLARAAAIRDMLVSKGVNVDRISLDFAQANSEKLKSPLVFELLRSTAKSEGGADVSEYTNKGGELAAVKFTFHDMTFSDANFEYNSDVFTPNQQFVLYADSVKTYLELNSGKTLMIIGHTDDVGSDDYNDNLGLRRAQSVRKYLKEMNLNGEILTDSKGKRYPMAHNTSEGNRKKNRRVNFVIE